MPNFVPNFMPSASVFYILYALWEMKHIHKMVNFVTYEMHDMIFFSFLPVITIMNWIYDESQW
jgi:hypothetical protein